MLPAIGVYGEGLLIDITFRTDKFNLSVVGSDFINDCCFGEDLSRWLASELPSAGIVADVICMEDFGWANLAECQGAPYLMCVAGNSDEDPANPNCGEWHVMLERERTLVQKLLGRNRISRSDPIVGKVARLLRDAGFAEVAVEP